MSYTYIDTYYGYHLLKHTQIVWVSSTDTLKFALVSSTYTYTTVLISFTKKMHKVSVYHLLIHTQLSGYLPKHTQIVWVSSINTYTNCLGNTYLCIQKLSGYHLSIHTQIVCVSSIDTYTIVWVTPIYAYKNCPSIIYRFIQKISGYHLSIHTDCLGTLS